MPPDVRIETYRGSRDSLRAVRAGAFTPASGYQPGFMIDGIELRDRVWLDRAVHAEL